jgi:hypothetical protein
MIDHDTLLRSPRYGYRELRPLPGARLTLLSPADPQA